MAHGVTYPALHMSKARSPQDDLSLKYGLRRCAGLEGKRDFFRSRDISRIDESEVALLKTRGITTIVDLRKSEERAVSPYPEHLADTFEVVPCPFDFHEDGRATTSMASDIIGSYGVPGERMVALYSVMALRINKIKGLVQMILAAKGGVLIHCMNGKDRAGVVCAYLQLTLGVSYSVVMNDYLITNSYNRLLNERDLEGYARIKTNRELAVLQAMFEARPEYLNAFLKRTPWKHETELTCQRVLEFKDV